MNFQTTDTRHGKDYHTYRKTLTKIRSLISKGYARKSTREAAPGKIWYLPHHGVYHPNKPGIRVVFDLSADYNDRFINRELLLGPDLTNQIAGALLRFREQQVAVMGT